MNIYFQVMNPASTILGLWNWYSPMWLVAAAAIGLYLWSHKGQLSARSGFFAAAVALFLIATVSPLNRLAHGYLFSAHMVHHLLLLLIVPGLTLLSLSSEVVENVLKRKSLSVLSAVFGYPLVAWAMGTGAMWLWHVPTFCVASQSIPSVGTFQTASLLAMGAAFWWPVAAPSASRRIGTLQGVGYLFTGCLACTALGIYLTFSPVNVCPSFLTATDPLGITPYLRNNLGLTPANDQQIGGLLMWVPACLIYLTGIFSLLVRWLGRPQTDIPAGLTPVRTYRLAGKK